MKNYIILATSITTHLNAKYYKGDVVPESEFSNVAELLGQKAIEEKKEDKPLKANKDAETI